MAVFDLLFMVLNLTVAIAVNFVAGNPEYWNVAIVIGVYILMTIFCHSLMAFNCRAYITGPNPQHLIVIIPGYIGYFKPCKGIQDSFKQHFNQNGLRLLNDADENIIVRLIRCNGNGFFCYTFWNTNDGIQRGSKRVAKEIKSIIASHPSINKLSIIGSSLGGMYGRYCLIELLDSNNTTINGQEIELMNFISLATPHLGTVDIFSNASCCCSYCCCAQYTAYSVGIAMKKYCCYPPTLQQLLLLDEDNLLKKMARDELFLEPLRLFRQRLIFGNGKNDVRVSCESALILADSDESTHNVGQDCWNQMIKNNEKILIQELTTNIETKSDEDCWFTKLKNDLEWKKIVVCFDYNDPHSLMNTPPFHSEKSRLFLDELHKNFIY